MSNETFDEYWYRLRETELKKDPARVDTKYQCKGAWNARGEVEQKKLQAAEEKIESLRYFIEGLVDISELDEISVEATELLRKTE